MSVSNWDYEQMCVEAETLRAENARLIAESDRYKLIVLSTMRQKAVGEVTEDNGVLGAVFYKDAEMQLGETIYAIPVSALALQERIDILLAEREQWMKQEPVFYATKNLNIVITAETYNCGTAIGQADYPVPLYTHPLPAQQVPENGSDLYCGKFYVGKFVGIKPESKSWVTLHDGEYKAFHPHQVSAAPKPEGK